MCENLELKNQAAQSRRLRIYHRFLVLVDFNISLITRLEVNEKLLLGIIFK
jgi:hypothetical protein